MHKVISCQNSHYSCYANTVISAQSSSFCSYPISINIHFNTLMIKIEVTIAVFLMHHIKVRL
ncbi:hypothetical protein D3C78_1821190 [compost metagenome]